MKKEVMEKWVAALRSGEYKQCRTTLQNNIGEYCALGVLQDLSGKKAWPDDIYLTDDCKKWAEMYSIAGEFKNYEISKPIWFLNDKQKLSFNEIADIIEKHYEEL